MIYPILTYSRDPGNFNHDLRELYHSGLKGIRLIYKGRTEADFALRIREIKEKMQEQNIQLDILIDLPGSKPIVGDLGSGLHVVAGTDYILTATADGLASTAIPTIGFFSHNSFPSLSVGDTISIADDELNLLIKSIAHTHIACSALSSFHLTSGRSISVKNKPFAFQANSDKDIRLVQHLQDSSVKLLVSFTTCADDILKLKALRPGIDVIPKIETTLDDNTLLEIMEHCHTVMLGRGDLSTSSQPNELFAFQQRLIHLCRTHNKRLIVATGLLAGIGDKGAPSIADVMDYSYLRHMGISSFLIAGSNAHKRPLETLQFMKDFEKQPY